MITLLRTLCIGTALMIIGSSLSAQTPTMQNYTAFPPFINQTVPPLVMLVLDKDHRMFLKAYNDITDLDNDGVIETSYKDSVQYDGYFDWTKCYTYNSSASPSGRFEPVGAATGANGHYCSGLWSGNFLNWATMARIDVYVKSSMAATGPSTRPAPRSSVEPYCRGMDIPGRRSIAAATCPL